MSQCTHYEYAFGLFRYDKCHIEDDVSSETVEKRNKESEGDWYSKYCKDSYYATRDCAVYKEYHGCHIVTAVCDTLKESKYIRISEGFKEKLIGIGKYQEQLAIYNAIGPIIANKIRGNERICRILLERTIKPVCKLIELGQEEMALKQFSDMVVQFIEPEYRTNQENVKPNGVFTELMQYDPKTIRDCEQTATTHFCTYQIDKYNQIQKRLGSIAIQSKR